MGEWVASSSRRYTAPGEMTFTEKDESVLSKTLARFPEAVSLAAFYQEKGKYILRLVNNNDSEQTTKLVLQGKTFNAAFGKYEVKTFVYDGKSLIEKEIWY